MADTGVLLPRALGRTGVTVSGLGVGGFHLGTVASQAEAVRLVHEAVDAGVTFFDNAWEYNAGRSEEWMGAGLAGRRERVFLMTKGGEPARHGGAGNEEPGRGGRPGEEGGAHAAGGAAVRAQPAGGVRHLGDRLGRGAAPEPGHRARLHAHGRGGAGGAARAVRGVGGGRAVRALRFELYKVSMRYDADEGRAQHGVPGTQELAG